MQEKFNRREGVEESLSRPANPPLRFASFVLDLEACTLARESGETIALTRGEFALLRMFVGRPGRVISRDALLDAFANRRFDSFDRSHSPISGATRRRTISSMA
jgi:two-component system OmpR family response regulator